MFSFDACLPTRIISGENTLSAVEEVVKQHGDRVFLVTGKRSMKDAGITDSLVRDLETRNISVQVFDKVETNPERNVINEGGRLAREFKSSVVIGLGGGSALDAAKAIAVLAAHGGDIWDYVEGKDVEGSPLPIIAIPSTAGTGSEVTPYTVISDRSLTRKDGFASTLIIPKVAILDDRVMSLADSKLTAYAGLDALSQAVEAYLTKLAHPYSDMLALESIRLCIQYLGTAVSDGKNSEARLGMAWASSLAGMAIALVDVVIGHHASEAIGAVYNTHHGLTAGLLLAPTMEFNFAESMDRLAAIAAPLGVDTAGMSREEKANSAVTAVRSLYRELGLPETFKDLGVTRASFPRVMEILTNRMDDLVAGNPKSITPASLEEFLEMIY